MAYSSLRDFMALLAERQQLIRVGTPVSTHLEMTEIHTRLLAEKGPAVIFDHPTDLNGHKAKMPVLTNLFGTVERVAWGMGQQPDTLRQIGQTLAFLRHPQPPSDWREAWELLPLVKTVLSMHPRLVRSATCQELILTGDQIDLGQLPIQQCWPGEPAPLITWPLVVTKAAPDKDHYNLGVYRMQVLGRDRTLMRWLRHRGGAQHHRAWQNNTLDNKMPAAVVLGADPALILAAVTPIPDTLSEYQFAGLLRQRRVELVPCHSVPLRVPAHAEIVLEGYVLDDCQPEGPYGDHTGYYNAVEDFPVFQITAVTMRRDPIYLTTFTGRPPDEPSVLGEALNEVFIPLLIEQFPEIVDFWLPPEGCSYRVGVVSIRKAYPGHAFRVMAGLWSFLRQFLYTKWLIVVDDDIDIRDWPSVIWAISTRMDPVRDIRLFDRTPIDYLDFASPEVGLGGKVGLDATNKLHPETHRPWGRVIRMTDEVIADVSRKWTSYRLPGSGKPIWKP